MKYAVVDSGPLIKGVRLEMVGAERLVTVPEVLLEIRDRATRDRIAALPFELEQREPSSEAVEAIKKFAKLTGDLPALSSVDTRVLALAWQLEKETKSGVGHLRTEPLPPAATARSHSGAKPAEPASTDGAAAEGGPASMETFYYGAQAAHEHSHEGADAAEEEVVAEEEDAEALEAEAALMAAMASSGGGGVAAVGAVDASDGGDGGGAGGGAAAAAGASTSSDAAAATGGGKEPPSEAEEAERAAALEARREARRRAEDAEAASLRAAASASSAADDGAEPWITVDNLKTVQARDGQRYAYAPDASTTVACLTTDYAMQSVLMQMGLKLLGADGMLLRSVKQCVAGARFLHLARAHVHHMLPPAPFGSPLIPSAPCRWVLRCSGCFTQQGSLEAQFCSKCGNNSLVRLQAVLNQHGHQRILPEQRAPARVRSTNVRGTKFPLPMPKTGRHAQNLILAEDQLAEATEKARRQGKAKMEDVFDPDYSLDDHFGRKGKQSGRGPAAAAGMPKVGYGKRANPNDVRSRPKRT